MTYLSFPLPAPDSTRVCTLALFAQPVCYAHYLHSTAYCLSSCACLKCRSDAFSATRRTQRLIALAQTNSHGAHANHCAKRPVNSICLSAGMFNQHGVRSSADVGICTLSGTRYGELNQDHVVSGSRFDVMDGFRDLASVVLLLLSTLLHTDVYHKQCCSCSTVPVRAANQ